MGRKAILTKEREDKVMLSKLIRDGIAESGFPASTIAERAGVHATHLSHVLRGKRSLGRDKLLALAEVLLIPKNKLLLAAGFSPSDEGAIDLSDVALVRSVRGLTLKVVTDPRFADSALFMWIFSQQPFSTVGISCELVRADWDAVPAVVSGQQDEYAIGFYNRKAVVRLGQREKYLVRFWTDLCLYKGYALMTPRTDGDKGGFSLSDAKRYLGDLKERCGREGRLPIVVSIGADTAWRLKTPLTPEFREKDFFVEAFGNADLALERFLDGFGDLFIGGLPQRLAAGAAGCRELLNYENNPFLFSLNSLICSDAMLRDRKAVLSAASALWFDIVGKMKSDSAFRTKVAKSCIEMLEDLRMGQHNLSTADFESLFTDGKYEVFPEQPSDLFDVLQDLISRSFEAQLESISMTDDERAAMRRVFQPALSDIGTTLGREQDATELITELAQ